MVDKVATDMYIKANLENIWNAPSIKFDKSCIAAIRTAAENFDYSHRDIVSGAGHDAVYIARVAPTAMIFIPCENGISHNEIEKTAPKHVAAGANVLLSAVVAYDKTMRDNR